MKNKFVLTLIKDIFELIEYKYYPNFKVK